MVVLGGWQFLISEVTLYCRCPTGLTLVVPPPREMGGFVDSVEKSTRDATILNLNPLFFWCAGLLPHCPANAQRERCPPRPIQGSGFRVQGSGFRFQVSGFRVQGSGFRVRGSEFRVQGSGFRVQGSGFRVQVRGSGFKVQGLGYPKTSLPLPWPPFLSCKVFSATQRTALSLVGDRRGTQLTGVRPPHGALRTFHRKSIFLHVVNFRALFGAN